MLPSHIMKDIKEFNLQFDEDTTSLLNNKEGHSALTPFITVILEGRKWIPILMNCLAEKLVLKNIALFPKLKSQDLRWSTYRQIQRGLEEWKHVMGDRPRFLGSIMHFWGGANRAILWVEQVWVWERKPRAYSEKTLLISKSKYASLKRSYYFARNMLGSKFGIQPSCF